MPSPQRIGEEVEPIKAGRIVADRSSQNPILPQFDHFPAGQAATFQVPSDCRNPTPDPPAERDPALATTARAGFSQNHRQAAKYAWVRPLARMLGSIPGEGSPQPNA